MRYEDCLIPYCMKQDCNKCKLKKDMEELKKGVKEIREKMIEPFVDELEKMTNEMKEKKVNEKTIQTINMMAVTIYSIEFAKRFAKEIVEYDKKKRE